MIQELNYHGYAYLGQAHSRSGNTAMEKTEKKKKSPYSQSLCSRGKDENYKQNK